MSIAPDRTPRIDFEFRTPIEQLVDPLDVDVYRELLQRALAQLASMTATCEQLKQRLREVQHDDRRVAA